MANPQTENGFISVANELWDEIIRRNFSKRQKDILYFILRLSYGCRNKSAFVPKLKDFELCGVGKTHITNELKFLVECRVIVWEKEESAFSINKDYEKWQVSPVSAWSREEFNNLIHQNLARKLPKQELQSTEKVTEMVTATDQGYQNGNHVVTETVTEELPKRELSSGSNPCGSKAEDVPKDSIKDSIKNSIKNNITTTVIEPPENDPLLQLQDAYCSLHGKMPFNLTQRDLGSMREMIDLEIPVPFIVQVMQRSYEAKRDRAKKEITPFKQPNSFGYYENAILDAWRGHQSKVKPFPKGGQENAALNAGDADAGRTDRSDRTPESNKTGWIRTKRNAELQVREM
ncbi:replication protein [Paenibacillus sp. RC84]|uniref:replication protein n=1 Tax=Paenibacillus sp. RC84 TaxID=3156252 RepID=UPI003515A626